MGDRIPTKYQQLDFEFAKEDVVKIGEMEKKMQKDAKWFRKYAEKEWLKHYHVMRLMAEKNPSPSLVGTFTDMPKSPSGGFYSDTEDLALKFVAASEWLEYFHSKLELLPDIHKEIIETKYLKRNKTDGNFVIDDIVCQELALTKTIYYKFKQEALHWLGLNLLRTVNVKTRVGGD